MVEPSGNVLADSHGRLPFRFVPIVPRIYCPSVASGRDRWPIAIIASFGYPVISSE